MYQSRGLKLTNLKTGQKWIWTAESCKPLKAQMSLRWHGWVTYVGDTIWEKWEKVWYSSLTGKENGVKKGLEQATGFYRLLITSHRLSQRAVRGTECIERAPRSPRVFVPASIATLNFKPISSGARSTCARWAKQGQFSLQYYAGRCDKNYVQWGK